MHKERVFCASPWSYILLKNDTHYAPCCRIEYKSALGRFADSRADLMTMFNSPEMQELRRSLAANDIGPSHPCFDCAFRKHILPSGKNLNMQPELLYNGVAPDLFSSVKAEYERGETVLSNHPVSIAVELSQECNISCVMCPQSRKCTSSFPFSNLKNIVKDLKGWGYVDSFVFMGGETLYVSGGREIIDYFAELGEIDTRLFFVTNGILLKEFAGKLDKLKNLFLNISIDGYGESYEKIRKGSSFRVIEQNLDAAAELKARHPEWTVVITSLIMKSTLDDLVNVMELARSKDFLIHFMPITGNFRKENIVLQDDFEDKETWKPMLDSAVKYAEEHGMEDAFNSLVFSVKHFEEKLANLEVFRKDIASLFSRYRKIVFFGMGHKFRIFLFMAGSGIDLSALDHCIDEMSDKDVIKINNKQYQLRHSAEIDSGVDLVVCFGDGLADRVRPAGAGTRVMNITEVESFDQLLF